MAKYIDEEKLKAEIKHLKLDVWDEARQFDLGARSALSYIEQFLDSLQQEQRETDGDDGKFVKISVRKELAEQIQRLGDEIQAGQSSFVGAMNQQKQPDKGLDVTEFCKPINPGIAKCVVDHWWEMLDGKDAEENQLEVDLASEIEAASKRYPEVSFAKLSRIAKRFYELGLKAKEESK